MEEKQFNSEQLAVIRASTGCHLVLAPPGCGKTAVLAERIVEARRRGVSFADMACLTFTNRASRGMRERIWQVIPDAEGLADLFVGNVHRFCSSFLYENRIVSEHTAVIDTDTTFSILADFLGEDELLVLADNRHRQRYSQMLNLQHLMYQCEHSHPSALMVHRDAILPAALRELCVAFGLPYSQASTIDLYRHADHYRDQGALLGSDAQQLLTAFYAARCYAAYKEQNDLIDFEDLLLLTYEAMVADHSDSYHRYSWVQVDEVQDLNPLQLAIIDLFTAPEANVVWLGDAQQAIFSFMGAKTDTLEQLRQRCAPGCFHNFYHNYRSPKYLLNVFNVYAQRQLGIAPELLPTTQNLTPQTPGDLQLMMADTQTDEAQQVARLVKQLYDGHPDETTAVIVAFNSDADEVSAALGQVPHFKISGQDFFASPAVRLLLAHLSVLHMEQNFIAWSHIFTGLRVLSSHSAARQFVHALMEQALSPADFICYDGSSYVAEFVSAFEATDLVVFDTETTGLDVFADDVVQLAAVRVRRGIVVDRLNLFIETDRPLPEMLGDIVNPLIAEYARQPHLSHQEALQRFATFAYGATLVGHNAMFDYQIMEHNMRRYAPSLSMQQLWPTCFDTLKLARLLHPRLNSYKLKDLLVQLGLEGTNSHLADDDIMATLSLARYCCDEGSRRVGGQLEFMSRQRKTIDRFRHLYADLYTRSMAQRYVDDDRDALVRELRRAYDYLREINRIDEQPKLKYLERYISHELITAESGTSLAQQLARHIQDLNTLKEADLCGADSMTERIVVSTVHKAKGLEFDNVVVYDAVEGKYPSAFATDASASAEEQRKFYVALSRARKRLCISCCQSAVTRYGRNYPRRPTPYLTTIRDLFLSGK